MSSPILSIKNLSRTVTTDDETRQIVDDVSYLFDREKIYTVIGPSGAGKSSLLRLLNRLDEPTSGEILFHDKPQSEYAPCELRKKIGYLFQTPYLFEETVRDNLLYADSTLNDSEIERLLDEVKIKQEFLNRKVDKLSVGEKQRVAFARLLATKPEIVLLDEPTSALDPGYTHAIESLIKEIVECEHLTAIVVTHQPEQALRIGQEALLMADGKLIESGDVDEIINNPKSEIGTLYKERKLR